MAKIGEEMDFMERFVHDHKVPRDALDHFASVPWTRLYLDDPVYKTIPTFSRVLKETGEDFFFARTLATPQTIPLLVSLQLKDLKLPAEAPKGTKVFSRDHTQPTEVPEKPDTIFLLKLARPGLDGHPSVIHGGVGCAILDEMMGLCVMLHHQHISGPRDSLFTVSLNVTYRAPVPTPSDVMVRAWLVSRQGRKWFSVGQITDKDGQVLTEAEGIWVMTKREGKI
jgi:acyl-coenzyme A thioesterase PaaI-like protein